MRLPQEAYRSSLFVFALSVSAIVFGSASAHAQISANPPNLNFGDVQIGTKPTLPVVLTNNGSSTVSITRGQIQGTGFEVTGVKLPIVLNPGGNSTINVTFLPLKDQTYSADVTGYSSSNPLISVPVTGNGTQSGYSVNLSWDPSESQIVGYNVYRGLNPGGPYGRINSALDPATSYSDYTVAAGMTYYYVTTAVNSSGQESPYSNQTEAIIP